MPYIITTTGPRHVPFDDGDYIDGTETTRIAVATLEEARDVVTGIVEEREPFSHKVQETAGSNLSAMRESGGTVGPLPDGTVIEVRAVAWQDLAPWPQPTDPPYRADIIAAFNGAHA